MACVRGDKKAVMVSLSPETVRHRTSAIYAPDAYLNDSLVELRGVQATEADRARSFEAVSDIDVEFHHTVRSGEDGYVRWTMRNPFRWLRGRATVAMSGMSHLRFDDRGRVVLHRDFWDPANGLYEHVPVLEGAIRMVKSRVSVELSAHRLRAIAQTGTLASRRAQS